MTNMNNQNRESLPFRRPPRPCRPGTRPCHPGIPPASAMSSWYTTRLSHVILSAAKDLWSGRTIKLGDQDPSLRSG